MVKKVHIYLIFAITVVISLFVAGCKKEEVVYPPLLDEAQVLERLKEKYGEEFIIHKKTDLLSLGEVVKASGPYSDIAEGIVYEASPENDPSFLFKVYTYRTYGNSSPIPFSKSGGVQADLEYRDCYGQDLLIQRFREKAEKYGIKYKTVYQGFRAYYTTKGKQYNTIDTEDYHSGVSYEIYINEKEIEEIAEKVSLCMNELMQDYNYKVGVNMNTWLHINIEFNYGKEEYLTNIGRTLFDQRDNQAFDISGYTLMFDMKEKIQERIIGLQNRRR